jgi:hypothetical protein
MEVARRHPSMGWDWTTRPLSDATPYGKLDGNQMRPASF